MPDSIPAEPCSSPAGPLAHLNLQNCYQCGKCTAGCPMAAGMDVVPNRVIRLLQAGYTERALRSSSIWLCVSCQTCSSRCPMSVDCCGVMDALRQISFERRTFSDAGRRTVIFLESFLETVRRNGRLSELELVASFKTRAFLGEWDIPFLFKEAKLAPRLASRGKLHLGGQKVRDRGVVGRIFARCMPRPGAVNPLTGQREAGA